MGKITIIEGNSNDKDNTRVFMVKGKDGVSPTIDLEEGTGTVTISVTDYEGTEETTISDPVVSVTKNNGVATISMTDKNGTTTATVADGADLTDGAVPQGAVIGFDGQTVPAGYEEVASSEDDVEVGTILKFGGSTWQVPNNYLLCNGQEISRNEYSDLFTVIGTSFGAGDGSTTFNLPDFSGRTGVGLDSEQTEFDTLGKTGGEKTHTLTVAEMPTHNHNSGLNAGGTSSGYGLNYAYSTEYRYYDGSEIIAEAGGSQAHNNLQPYITVNYIIKALKGTIKKTIKKVSVSPLPRNEATVIDSLNTSDSQTTNAPSIRAVKQAFIDAEAVETASVLGLNSDDKLTVDLYFKKSGKVVQVTAVMSLNAGAGNKTGSIYAPFTMPDFAKVSMNYIGSIVQLISFSGAGQVSSVNPQVILSDAEALSITHLTNDNYSLVGFLADGYSTDGTSSKVAMGCYIID